MCAPHAYGSGVVRLHYGGNAPLPPLRSARNWFVRRLTSYVKPKSRLATHGTIYIYNTVIKGMRCFLFYFKRKRTKKMTCPHLSHSIINKSKGGSIIASASYNKREKMFDELEGRMKYSHTSAADHELNKMLLPDGAPERYTDPSRIWNDLNKIESDKVGYKLIIPFQRELSYEQNLELAIELMNEVYVKKGYPVQIDVHRGKNNNDHLHAIAADRRLINGAWDEQKTETIYYKRGTVKELDKKGNVINPDAVILTLNDKIDTPKLKRKKLQYDKSGNIIMEKGWQELQYDANGKPLLDDKGYPVMVDIREPYYIQDKNSAEYSTREIKYSKNGKYRKPQYKKATIKHGDISDTDSIIRIRKTWERLQNEAYQKYNILDENGKILSVDLRSYKEQNKDRAEDQQLIPTKHVGYGEKQEELINYNEIADNHNRLVKEIRTKAQALKAEKEKLAHSENALAAMQQDKEKFYALLNPRQAYINIWTARYNELTTQRKDYEFTVLSELQSGRKLNADRRNRIDRYTKKGNAAWNRLNRHDQLMKKISTKIQSDTESVIDIATLAGKKFDTFTNKEIVSFICARYGYDTSTIAADVLERTNKDNSNALSGRDEKSPYFPKNNTNATKLKQSIKVITGNPDIAAVTKEAFATWDKAPDEAPPKTVIDVLDSYRTAEEAYNATLSGKKWNIVRIEKNYNPDAINQDYRNNAELKSIAPQVKQATVQTALSIAAGLANQKTSAPSGKILRQDERPMTEDDRIHREYFGDGTDAIDELPNHKPQTNAIRELQNVLSTFQDHSLTRSMEATPQSAEPATDNTTVSSANNAPNREAETQAQDQVVIMRRIDDDREEKRKKEKAAAEKELQSIRDKRIEITSELRTQVGTFRYEQYLIEQQQNAQNIEEKYPEMKKYPETSEPLKKFAYYYADRQMNLVINDAKTMGFPDPNGFIPQYQVLHQREQELYRIVHSDDPANGQAASLPKVDKQAERIHKARLEAARKRREKEKKRKQHKGKTRT